MTSSERLADFILHPSLYEVRVRCLKLGVLEEDPSIVGYTIATSRWKKEGESWEGEVINSRNGIQIT